MDQSVIKTWPSHVLAHFQSVTFFQLTFFSSMTH